MTARPDKSPLALTETLAAVLRVVVNTPLLDIQAIARACTQPAGALEQLRTRGLVTTQEGQRRDATVSTLYRATRKGFAALDRYDARHRVRVAARTPPVPSAKSYACPELGRTCHRPGAYDAFGLPSRFGNELRLPKVIA